MRKSIQVITMPWSCFSDHTVYCSYKHCSLIINLFEKLVFYQLIVFDRQEQIQDCGYD